MVLRKDDEKPHSRDDQDSRGLRDLTPGRHSLTLSCDEERESVLVEKRGQTIAIKISGSWHAVDGEGAFAAQLHRPDQPSAGLTGTVSVVDGRLVVEAFAAATSTAERRCWSGTTDLQPEPDPHGTRDREIVLNGTARYSLLDGPTETPLRIEVRLLESPDRRALLLPPAITMNRGEIEIPIAADGSFAYRASDGTLFKVNGRLEPHGLELVLECAGSLGWTRKELSAVF